MGGEVNAVPPADQGIPRVVVPRSSQRNTPLVPAGAGSGYTKNFLHPAALPLYVHVNSSRTTEGSGPMTS